MSRARGSTSRDSLGDSWVKSGWRRRLTAPGALWGGGARGCGGRGGGGGQRRTDRGAAPAGRGFGFGAGQHLCEQLLRDVGVAKIGIEQFTEHHAVLLATDQH